jgi:hypothetical protein
LNLCAFTTLSGLPNELYDISVRIDYHLPVEIIRGADHRWFEMTASLFRLFYVGTLQPWNMIALIA